MKQNHLFTNVTAMLTLFVVVLVGGTAAGTGHVQFTDPSWRIKDQPFETREHETQILTSTDVGIFSSSSAENMKKVFLVGREVGNPETMQAILLQETNGGVGHAIGNKASPVGKRSYGLMQIQVVAARSILQRTPTVFKKYFPDRTYDSVADEEIIALLLTNDEANIRIAAYHFKLYLQLCGGDWDRAVAAYNAGIGGVNGIPQPSEFGYVVGVKAKLDSAVRPFNRKNNLQLTQRF